MTIDAKNYQEPEGAEWTREKLISELLSRQLADGGFGLIKTDPSDVDLTSMVLTALAPYRGQDKTYTYTGIISGQEETSTVDAVAEKAFARLSELQADDGSMLTYDERTSESTAWAMIALASWGSHAAPQWMLDAADYVTGQWFTPLREALDAFADSLEKTVTGDVKLKLYKGNMINAGIYYQRA